MDAKEIAGGWPLRGAVRTFVVATLALFVPGLLGWLNALTEWAGSAGEMPFPDGMSLAYLGVSAITAGVIALVQYLWNAVETASGKGFLRDPAAPGEGTAPPRHRGESGSVYIGGGVLTVVVIVVLLIILL